MAGSESFLGPRRSCGGGLQDLGHSVAVWPQRRGDLLWAEARRGGGVRFRGGCGMGEGAGVQLRLKRGCRGSRV